MVLLLFSLVVSTYVFNTAQSAGEIGASLISRVVASNGGIDDEFGNAVSIYNDWAVVGAKQCNSGSGCAYIFKYDNMTDNWNQTQVLNASEETQDAEYGYVVSIFNENMIIGTGNDVKRAFIYVLDDSSSYWVEDEVLRPTSDNSGVFGMAVDITDKYAVVGDWDNGDLGYRAGNCDVYMKNDSGVWNRIQSIYGNDTQSQDKFGNAVAISQDSQYIIVGANSRDGNTGAVYVFELDPDDLGTGLYYQTALLFASDGAGDHSFGTSVSISVSMDNNNEYYAVVGAPFNGEGAAYIFEKDESISNGWNQVASFSGCSNCFAWFGQSVAIYNDIVAVSATNNEQDDVYIYQRDGMTGTWQLGINNFGTFENRNAAHKYVSVFDNMVMIGADRENDDTGAAYIYSLSEIPTSTPTTIPTNNPSTVPTDGMDGGMDDGNFSNPDSLSSMVPTVNPIPNSDDSGDAVRSNRLELMFGFICIVFLSFVIY